jgi:hypothetical protein
MAEFVDTRPNPPSHVKPKKMSLAEFLSSVNPPNWQTVRTGTFSACHVAFYKATGIWVPELVDVFKKLDASLVLREDIQPVGV